LVGYFRWHGGNQVGFSTNMYGNLSGVGLRLSAMPCRGPRKPMRLLLEIRASCVTSRNGSPRDGTFPHALAFNVQGRSTRSVSLDYSK
jgi:hypothetical protein